MRVVVYGVGAIGGCLAARLALSGTDVVGIARGAMREAIKAAGGLMLISNEGSARAAFDVVADPSEIDWGEDDIVVLAVKSNDTADALGALSGAGVYRQPIVCAQNGVTNESYAMRLFPNVYGAMVLMLAEYLEAGTVVTFNRPKFGYLAIGRLPPARGEETCAELAAVFEKAGFLVKLADDVMPLKYGKLRRNLGNVIGAALGRRARGGHWHAALSHEADEALRAAGIAWIDPGDDPLLEQARSGDIPGIERVGGSTTQSLIRGTRSVETDYLNGEIVRLGRLHGVPTPVNSAFVCIAHRMVRQGMAAGTFPVDEVSRLVEAAR